MTSSPPSDGKLLQEFFLLRRETRRCFHRDAHMLIALLISLNVFDSFALHAKKLARLRAGGDFHFDFAVQRRHVDLRAQRRLHEADRHVADNVEVFAHENRMRLDLNHDVKIARVLRRLRRFLLRRAVSDVSHCRRRRES